MTNRHPLTAMTVAPPRDHFVKGNLISKTVCMICRNEQPHSMTNHQIKCRRPTCPKNCGIVMRMKVCELDPNMVKFYQSGDHTPPTETNPAVEALPSRRLPADLVRLATRNASMSRDQLRNRYLQYLEDVGRLTGGNDAPTPAVSPSPEAGPAAPSMPSDVQLNNLIGRVRRQLRTKGTTSLARVIRELNGLSPESASLMANTAALPEDKAYVFGSQISEGRLKRRGLLVGITSKKALGVLRYHAGDNAIIHIDGTYGVNAHRFPSTWWV